MNTVHENVQASNTEYTKRERVEECKRNVVFYVNGFIFCLGMFDYYDPPCCRYGKQISSFFVDERRLLRK